MTNPSDPGHPSRSRAPGQPAGPYGPPPGPQQQGVPGPRAPGPGAPGPGGTGPGGAGAAPHGQQEWVPPERSDKGLLGALLDANFNSLVTPKLTKVFYVLALMLVSLQCLCLAVLGLWITASTPYWVSGLVLILATPLIWVFEMLLVRIFMEAVVVRFKQAEYLRVIKDKL